VVAELVEDLLGLEGGEDGLDQRRRADGAPRDPERRLRVDEHVVPQARLQVALHLRKVEIRPGSPSEELAGVVAEVEPEVEQAPGDRPAAHENVLLGQVPAARPYQERGRPLVQPVALALGAGEGDRAADGVPQVDMPVEQVLPGRRRRVLEVRHEDLRPRVERVDDHLAVHGAGDLRAPVEEVGRRGGHLPQTLADRQRRRQEVRQHARIELRLAGRPSLQQRPAPRLEFPKEPGDERARPRRQDLGVFGRDRRADFEAGWGRVGHELEN